MPKYAHNSEFWFCPMSVSQSLPCTPLLAGSSWTTHTLLFFYFEYGDNLCNVVFFSFLLSSARART